MHNLYFQYLDLVYLVFVKCKFILQNRTSLSNQRETNVLYKYRNFVSLDTCRELVTNHLNQDEAFCLEKRVYIQFDPN